ncbi:hypothetical protein ACIQAC_18450 [Streptomyces sp. NPDC088387]|uniref:hypothetical protein n=1 Tax=Streptomyces sp. NPDC088387 TaxID=3365859 RepID=UPI0038135FA1
MASGLLLAGCTSGGDGGDGGDGPSRPASAGKDTAGTPSASPTEVVDIDPGRLPDTNARAGALIRDVLPDPAAFGPGAARQQPYESDPARWAVLGDDCVWQQQPLPRDVLASLTRSYEIPAAGGKETLRLAAVVTVHRTAEQADWENAEVLEEMMRCPTQQLRADELVTSLNDVPSAHGESGNEFAEDSLTELGEYASADTGDASFPYIWEQTRIGQFTLAVSAKGAEGWTQAELFDRLRQPHVDMRGRLRAAIERDPQPGTDPQEPSADTKGEGS